MRHRQPADVVGNARLVGEVRRVFVAVADGSDVFQRAEDEVRHACGDGGIRQRATERELVRVVRECWRGHEEGAVCAAKGGTPGSIVADSERGGDHFRPQLCQHTGLRRGWVAGEGAHAVLSAAQQGGGDATALFAGRARDGNEGLHEVLRF